MLKSLTKRGILNDQGIKTLPVSAHIAAHGQSYYQIREFLPNVETLNALFIKQKRFTTLNLEVSTVAIDPDATIPQLRNQVVEYFKAGQEDMAAKCYDVMSRKVDVLLLKEQEFWDKVRAEYQCLLIQWKDKPESETTILKEQFYEELKKEYDEQFPRSNYK